MIHDDSVPRHIPHLVTPEVLSMGLRPLDPRNWIETDTSLLHLHRHTLAMREQHGEAVYAALPSSLAAQRELLSLLCGHLIKEHAVAYRRDGAGITSTAAGFHVALAEADPEPLWRASLLIADDLVIMQPSPDGYLLAAASLASPSHWRLQDKLGRPMRAVHDPIPGMHRQLTPRIDRFFSHISPERPVLRFNWALQADSGLYHPAAPTVAVGPDSPLYYRVERQTLRRLPRSGAIAFTIRVFLHPLATLGAVPGAIQSLVSAVDATPPALAAYKGFPSLRDALEKYRLESAAEINWPRSILT
ncbi:MAG: DUF3445 domain-containing protein [Chromatocurvus sp.]